MANVAEILAFKICWYISFASLINDTDNGKTTMGWILSNKDLKNDIIDKNFDKLHNIMEEMVK